VRVYRLHIEQNRQSLEHREIACGTAPADRDCRGTCGSGMAPRTERTQAAGSFPDPRDPRGRRWPATGRAAGSWRKLS
jgi:hypothetical protein